MNGVVFVGSDDHYVYALNAANGDYIWSYKTGGTIDSSPAVANGVVYIGSEDHKVYAINATSGVKLWSYNTGDQVESSPAVVNGVVYVGSDDNKVYALNAQTGTKNGVTARVTRLFLPLQLQTALSMLVQKTTTFTL